MFCYNCGAKLPEDSRFCPECGTKLNYGATSAAPTPEAAPVYEQPSVNSAQETMTPIYVQPIPVPQVKEVQSAPQPAPKYVQPAPQPQASISGVSVVRRTVRPLGGIILMFLAIANILLMPLLVFAFRMRSLSSLMFDGVSLIAAVLILFGMFLHHKNGNILTGIGTILLLVKPVYYVILNRNSIPWLLRNLRGGIGGIGYKVTSGEIVYRTAQAMMFVSYLILIVALLFIALYYLIGGKTFGNPLKLFCGLAVAIFGSVYAIGMIVLMVSSNAFVNERIIIYNAMNIVTTWSFWLFVGISLIIYTPFKKVRNN